MGPGKIFHIFFLGAKSAPPAKDFSKGSPRQLFKKSKPLLCQASLRLMGMKRQGGCVVCLRGGVIRLLRPSHHIVCLVCWHGCDFGRQSKAAPLPHPPVHNPYLGKGGQCLCATTCSYMWWWPASLK